MPYSDNLYSANDEADESDGESFSNELSPTDGFFNNRSRMPPDALVPDPSHRGCTTEDKVLIARHEARTDSERASNITRSPTLSQLFPSQSYAPSQSGPNPASSSTSTTLSTPMPSLRTENRVSEHSPLMQGPPPAYTASSPTSVDAVQASNEYSTFQPHLLEQGLFPHREPQNMGGPVENPDESTPLTNRRIPQRQAIVRKIILVLLVIAVVAPVMTLFTNGRKQDAPDGSDGMEPPRDGKAGDSTSPYCASATFKKDEIIHELSLLRDLRVLQTTHDGDVPRNYAHVVTTAGEIRLRRLPKDSKYDKSGYISLDINVSDPSLYVLKSWDTSSYTLNISTPRYTHLGNAAPGGRTHCISLEITVWLPEDAQLLSLGLESITLTQRVLDDVKINISGSAWFESVTGDVYFPLPSKSDPVLTTNYPFDSRQIVVETVSGDIKGIYPLYDVLKLSSQSGDITVGVYPQTVLPSAPAPANLEASTASGNIQVNLPVQVPRYSPPPRDYVTNIESVSGDITGGFFQGSSGSFKSASGDIKLNVLPVIQSSSSTDPDQAPKTQLETRTVSGDTKVEILDPVFIALPPSGHHIPDERHSPDPYIPIGDDDPYLLLPPQLKQDLSMVESSVNLFKKWRTLEASHRSSSGKVRVLYPDAWEGTVSAGTVSGAIKVGGDGLKIIKARLGWGRKEVVGAKGVDEVGQGSTVVISNIAGDLNFVVGEEE